MDRLLFTSWLLTTPLPIPNTLNPTRKDTSVQLALLLYVASIADNIRSSSTFFIWAFGIVTLVSAISTIVAAMNMWDVSYSAQRTGLWETARRSGRMARKSATYSFYAWAALLVLSQLVPSKQDLYIVAASYVTLKAVNSEVAQATSNTVLTSMEQWLDKELTRDARKETLTTNKVGH
jgi:hypothetical protein